MNKARVREGLLNAHLLLESRPETILDQPLP
jgi:hypothetical protein